MKQLKLIIIIFLITSFALGDKLYLWDSSDKNWVVYEGRYEGIVDGRPIFIFADTNTPIDFNPEDFLKIENYDGDTIVLAKQNPDGEIYFRELKRQPIPIKVGPPPPVWPFVCLCLVVVVVVVVAYVVAPLILWEALLGH
ncbi:MAG: hypothetical protein IIA61_14725 [Candidatus Marinimicrobia bacterium]|nr:hypothetical protein [Candidatus Neomarinimicrobiota bacterium]